MCFRTVSYTAFSGVDQLMKVGSGENVNSLNISWSPPVTPHGFAITKYIVTVVNNETEVRSAHRSEFMTTSSYFITGTDLSELKVTIELLYHRYYSTG